MKQFSEIFPVVAFLIALWLKDIYVATAVLMIATALQVALLLLTKQKITSLQWAVNAMVFVFGALTLGLHDERFIKIKPTVVYAMMAAAFVISLVLFKKNLSKTMLGTVLNPPETEWRNLDFACIALFTSMAVVNWLLAYFLPTQQWAFSKIGFIVLTFVFTAYQVYRLRAYLKEPQ